MTLTFTFEDVVNCYYNKHPKIQRFLSHDIQMDLSVAKRDKCFFVSIYSLYLNKI